MQINSFYFGKKLNLMEQLTIVSFLNQGHSFKLYTYDNNICDIKHNSFNIIDANEILDKKYFFTYDGKGDCPANSVGGFSDIFRFSILEKNQGWYVDMDVTCLKDFNHLDQLPCVFRPNKNYGAVANIIKCENKQLISEILAQYKECITPMNNEWVKPLNIFYELIKNHNLENYIIDKKIFGDDNASDLLNFINKNIYELNNVPEYAIHWCNTACTTASWNKRLKIDWNNPRPASLYYCLLKKNGLIN